MWSVKDSGDFEIDVLFGNGLHSIFGGEASEGSVVKGLQLPLFGEFEAGAGVKVVDGREEGDGSNGKGVSGVGGFGDAGDGYA